VERTLGDRRGSRLALFLLGMVQAAAFCPATAGLFLGVLLPFAIAQEAPGLVALGFGVGYGIPLLAVTAGLEMGVRLESFRGKAEGLTYWSGWVLIALGAWETWRLV
jgi:cytochrome c biogenesis protein CcdA